MAHHTTNRIGRVLLWLAGPIYPLPAVSTRLIDCPRCGLDFVNPVRWEPQGETHWWMRLRCGHCGFVREAIVPNDDAEQFSAELDQGTFAIADAVARSDRARMLADAEVLSSALEHDLIDADDFAR
jgi:hypothetical protein